MKATAVLGLRVRAVDSAMEPYPESFEAKRMLS